MQAFWLLWANGPGFFLGSLRLGPAESSYMQSENGIIM